MPRYFEEELLSFFRRLRVHQDLQPLYYFLGFPHLRKFLFRFPKFPGVHTAACPLMLHGIAQVEHFVEHNVVERKGWDLRPIENPADDNRVMRRIEMAQHASGGFPAPSQARTS